MMLLCNLTAQPTTSLYLFSVYLVFPILLSTVPHPTTTFFRRRQLFFSCIEARQQQLLLQWLPRRRGTFQAKGRPSEPTGLAKAASP
jgi:hypothetical protein